MSTEQRSGRTGPDIADRAAGATGLTDGTDATATPASAVPADLLDPRLAARQRGLAGYLDVFRARLKGGELGAIPVILGLLVIVAIFQSRNPVFLSPFNLVNLALQIAAVGSISIGIVLVLLLGEIDLSVGSVSGLCSAILVVLNTSSGIPAVPAVALALLAGAVIGLLHGLVFTKLGVPSFVVTLAGLLAWLGLQLRVLGDAGTINLPPGGGLLRLGQASYLTDAASYVVAVLVALAYLAAQLAGSRARAAAGLSVRPLAESVVRAVLLAAALLAVSYMLNQDRGVPTILVIFLALVVIFDLVTQRTRYGRSIYAIGGNIEAARRAGISVDRVRISVFALASTFAALGGILATTRLGSVSQQSGAGDTLINAIAAAVIGGTSLFGGRGRTYSALLGILVIGAISNGLTLLRLSSDVRFMITGGVLLAAVTIDALSRRGRQASGRG